MEKQKKNLKILLASSLVIAIIASFAYMLLKKQGKSEMYTQTSSAEHARAMTYSKLTDEDKVVEGTNGSVEFSAFFLRDLDGDGYAEPLKGTCKEIGSQDNLYMELNVSTDGYLKNRKNNSKWSEFLFGNFSFKRWYNKIGLYINKYKRDRAK